MRDIALDPVSGDLDLSGGQLKLTTGANRSRQRLFLRLGLHKNEWFLDQNAGIPTVQLILGKGTSLATIESIYRRAITTCPSIASLASYTQSLGADRVLSIDFEARDLEGNPIAPFDAFVWSGT